MELLLIKFGKAWSALRRDGLWRGGQRVLRAFFFQFRRVAPGDILIITNGVGDSARYRAWHVAEELRLHGLRASVTLQDNPFLRRYAKRFQVFVFHRTLATEGMRRFFEELKRQGKTVVFETDDLIYDPAYLRDMDYFTRMNALEKRLYAHGVGGEFLADPYVRYATTTTSFLKRKLEERGKQVFLVRNKLSREDTRWADAIRQKPGRSEHGSGLVWIGYLSGTPSHNRDFATIAGALSRILTEFAQARLVLAGPLDTDDALNRFSAQIERVPFAPRKEFFETIAKLDINVAPLEIGNPFCESKSELKFFEAGLLGVPTVAAATETFREAIAEGQDGFVAATEEEWYAKLAAMVQDATLRHRLGESARAKALTRYTTREGSSPEYYAFLRSLIR